MSATSAQPPQITVAQQPQNPAGPREQRLQWIWQQVWDNLTAGQVYGYYLSLADSELLRFRAALPLNDQAAATDMLAAENINRAQSKHFEANLAIRSDERSKIAAWREAILSQVQKLSFFSLQMLALANGSAVLGALTYLGREGVGRQTQNAFVFVIAFGSIGFLLSLMSAHVSALLSQRPLGILMDLTALHISAQRIAELWADFKKTTGRMTIWSRVTGYSAVACLVGAIASGTYGIMNPQGAFQMAYLTDGRAASAVGIIVLLVGLIWSAKTLSAKPPQGAPPPASGSANLYVDLDASSRGLWIAAAGGLLQLLGAIQALFQ